MEWGLDQTSLVQVQTIALSHLLGLLSQLLSPGLHLSQREECLPLLHVVLNLKCEEMSQIIHPLSYHFTSRKMPTLR